MEGERRRERERGGEARLQSEAEEGLERPAERLDVLIPLGIQSLVNHLGLVGDEVDLGARVGEGGHLAVGGAVGASEIGREREVAGEGKRAAVGETHLAVRVGEAVGIGGQQSLGTPKVHQ